MMYALSRIVMASCGGSGAGRNNHERWAVDDSTLISKPAGAVSETTEELPPVLVTPKGFVCDTEPRGHASPGGRSPLELVVDATEGFIPLWAKDTVLRWRFREASLSAFDNPQKIRNEVKTLFAEALILWDFAVPIKFTEDNDLWDFEIDVSQSKNCNVFGCVLASAFFPDSGRHRLTVYPSMFEQDADEQVETMIHETGHMFFLRHWFAKIDEQAWPSEIWGEHSEENPFSIMNYGDASRLTDVDKSDLFNLYDQVWSGKLKAINGTEIRLVHPYHLT
jgi:hypothetical protein